jgi:hypothetical protein
MEDGLVRAKRNVPRAIAANAADPNACPFVRAADGAHGGGALSPPTMRIYLLTT